MVPNQEIKMTQEGIDTLKEELEYRSGELTHNIVQRLKEARAQGDLSENSEYDDAKEAQASNEARIQEIQEILKYAVAGDQGTSQKGHIGLGSVIVVKDIAIDKDTEYKLVSAQEADTYHGKLSISSPLGEAVEGKKVGDIVAIQAPIGELKYKIVQVLK